jgi:hypothetical protein
MLLSNLICTNLHCPGGESTVGCSNVSLDQQGTSTLHYDNSGPVTNNRDEQIQQGKTNLSGQSWYSRLSVEQKADYIQRQRISRQKKKMAAAQSGVNCKELSEKTAVPSLVSQHIPLSNITKTDANGT